MALKISFNINARLGPFERGEHFEDPLYDWLEERGVTIIDGGGGTFLSSDGSAQSDFFVEVEDSITPGAIVAFVESLGVPAGSSYRISGEPEVPFGAGK